MSRLGFRSRAQSSLPTRGHGIALVTAPLAHMHMQTHPHTHAHIRPHTCMYTRMCTCMHTCTDRETNGWTDRRVDRHACRHMGTCMHTHPPGGRGYLVMYAYAHMHARKHKHTHTHTHTAVGHTSVQCVSCCRADGSEGRSRGALAAYVLMVLHARWAAPPAGQNSRTHGLQQ